MIEFNGDFNMVDVKDGQVLIDDEVIGHYTDDKKFICDSTTLEFTPMLLAYIGDKIGELPEESNRYIELCKDYVNNGKLKGGVSKISELQCSFCNKQAAYQIHYYEDIEHLCQRCYDLCISLGWGGAAYRPGDDGYGH